MNRLCAFSLVVGVVLFGVVVACGGSGSKQSSPNNGSEATPTSVSVTSTTSPAIATSTTAPPAAAGATSTTAPPPAAATNTTVPPAPAATSTTAPPAPTSTTAPPPAGVTFNVQVFSLGFNSNSLSAKIGQPVTVNVSNTAGVPHTFSIDGVTGADTGTIGPGTTKSITFTPTAEGSLTFYCKIHGANAMKGTLTVTP